MDVVLVHRIVHYVLEDGRTISFAVPYEFRFSKLPFSGSGFDLQTVCMVGIPSARPVPLWVPVFTGDCQFSPRNIRPPCISRVVEQNSRAAAPGCPSPSWCLEYDSKLIVETEPEQLPDDCLLVSTIPVVPSQYQWPQFQSVDMYSSTVVGWGDKVYMPFCPAHRVQVVDLIESVGDLCFLRCREENAECQVVLRLPAERVETGSFCFVGRVAKVSSRLMYVVKDTLVWNLRVGYIIGADFVRRAGCWIQTRGTNFDVNAILIGA
ncbi:hypothetical protein DFH06DRAFT_1350142 [Mycena polygramma]|nr:hypothetical protein DFH06DRAFT_1350142 [Mycena polygramma]